MTRLPLTARLLGQTGLVALPALALAQPAPEAGPVVDLGEITFSVLGADPVGDRANPFTLTGVKTPTPITEVPQSVSVVSAEQVAAANAAKIDEALAYTTGVQAAPFAYDSDTNWIYSRGFDATQSGVFLDGLQLYAYAFGGFYIDPFLIERIEVLRGPSSTLYGASNPGGVVNYVSRLPGGEPGALLEFGADTEGRAWSSFDLGGTTEGDLAYRFGAKFQRVDGDGMFEDGLEGVVTGGIATTFDNGGTLTVSGSYTGMDEDHVGGAWLPYYGTVEPVGFGTFDEDFNTGEPGVDSYLRDQWLLTAIYRQDLGAWRLTNTARYERAHVEESSVYAYGYTGFAITPQDAEGNLSRLVFKHDTTATGLHNDLRLEQTLATGGAEHRLLLGFDAKYYQLDQVQASATGTGLSATNPVYGAAQPDAVPYIDQELTQTGLGLYAQDQVRWGDGWIATLNGRYDIVHTEAGTNEATSVAGVDREDGEFSWRMGLAKEIGDFVPYVSAGTYFNPQVVNDPAGDEVEPETGRQVEAGLKWSPDDRTLLTFAAFETTRENISQTQWNGAGYDYFQIGEVRSRGIEVEAQGEIARGLTYRASLTKLDVEIVDDVDPTIVGNTPYVVAEDQAAFSIAWEPMAVKGLTLSAGVRFLGESWVDNQNTLRVPSTMLYDAGVSYDFAGVWTANLDISNLTDEDYVAACQTAYWCYQGEGRNVSLALRKSF